MSAPEKIWAKKSEATWGNGLTTVVIHGANSQQDGMAEYTRTDTIPSRAQVDRVFMDEARELYTKNQLYGIWWAMQEVLKEWEEADGK